MLYNFLNSKIDQSGFLLHPFYNGKRIYSNVVHIKYRHIYTHIFTQSVMKTHTISVKRLYFDAIRLTILSLSQQDWYSILYWQCLKLSEQPKRHCCMNENYLDLDFLHIPADMTRKLSFFFAKSMQMIAQAMFLCLVWESWYFVESKNPNVATHFSAI